jgi:hypothetical protein
LSENGKKSWQFIIRSSSTSNDVIKICFRFWKELFYNTSIWRVPLHSQFYDHYVLMTQRSIKTSNIDLNLRNLQDIYTYFTNPWLTRRRINTTKRRWYDITWKKEKSDIISREEKKDQKKERYGRWRLHQGPKYKYSKGFKHPKFETTESLINLPIEEKIQKSKNEKN